MSDRDHHLLPPDTGRVYSACPHDCPDACSIISYVQQNRLTRIQGNPDHPVTQGFICRKFSGAPERVYASDRLHYPLLRTGEKGAGVFRRISWQSAIATIAERWRALISHYGPYCILPFYGSGTEGLINGKIAGKRFFNRLGTLQLDRTICTKSGREGYRYTMGTSSGADPAAIARNKLIIAWGCNTASTNIHHQTFLKQARQNGAALAVINPVKVRGSEAADYLLSPRPGTDGALALGMMHVIIAEGLYDQEFIDRYTLGFDALKQTVNQYSLDKVAAITDIPATAIRDFALVYARLRPSFIYVGPGCQRHSNGGMTLRTLACLPALVGAWQHKGSGLYFPTSTIFPVDTSALEGEELRPNAPEKYNMIELADRLAQKDPQVQSLYVFNGNPATVLYNQNKLRAALRREDLFTIVHDQYLTDTARYADLVLPATTQFEQSDLLFSYYHFSVLLNHQAIEPVPECRSNLDTFRLLADAMGFTDACFQEDSWDIINSILALDHPGLSGITMDKLLANGWQRANIETADELLSQSRLPTPSGRIEFYSELMKAHGHYPLPWYVPPRESRERTPELYRQFPLHFLTSSTHSSLNSNYAQFNDLHGGRDSPTLIMHPQDAAVRQIKSGDFVAVFNQRGRCRLVARVDDSVKPGVVASQGLWWDRQYPDGTNPNHTTPDFTGDIGGGSAFNSNLVEVMAVTDSQMTTTDIRHAC